VENFLLGLEVGTSALKAVLYDLAGAERFVARRAYRLATPQPGWAEQDADEIWCALVAILREAAEASAGHGRIETLALAAQAGSVVPVDAAGAPLAPLITWLDRRAEPIVAGWRMDGVAARIRQLSGWHPHPGLALASIAWLTHHAPAVAKQTVRFLDVQGFLLQRLAGRPLTDFSEAAELLLLDRTTRTWSPELCTLAGISPTQLSELAPAGTVAGQLLPAVARLTGLPPELTVVVGGQDQCCAALGMGVMASGQLMLASGTAWVLTALAPNPHLDQMPAGMDLNFHVVRDVYTVSQLLGGFGAAVDWWLNLLGFDAPSRYRALETALAESPPGANDLLFLSLGGSVQTSNDVQTGGPGGFIGLRLDHTRADMVRALCEGAAYEVRWALEVLDAAHLPAQQMWMSGGATHSAGWPALLADITGIPLHVAHGANWPARGAATLAGLGAGLLGNLESTLERWRLPLAEILPNASTVALYDAHYAAYRALAARLALGGLYNRS
jgi:xylulokinase